MKKNYLSLRLIYKFVSAMICATALFYHASALTYVSGTWYNGLTYYITDDIEIPSGQTLLIEPGVTVIFMDSFYFLVSGSLYADGQSTNSRILFTADNITRGWRGIRFVSNNYPSELKYCSFEYCFKPFSCSSNPLNDLGYPRNMYTSGGAIYMYNSSNITIENCLFQNNEVCAEGGAIYCNFGSSPQISSNTLVNNFANRKGGAICLRDNSNPLISSNQFTTNHAPEGGGALWIVDNCSPEIVENTFDQNGATGNNPGDGKGGAIGMYDNATPLIEENDFSQNIATNGSGGAIYSENCSPNILKNNFTENIAEEHGGAIYINSTAGSNMRINRNYLQNNEAYDNGGGIWIFDASPDLYKNELISNIAGDDGGGMYLEDCNSEIINCLIVTNYAVNYGGGIYFNSTSTSLVYNCTIADNAAGNDGGGVYSQSSTSMDFINTIVYFNTPNSVNNILGLDASQTYYHNCDFEGFTNFIGTTNIDDDPEFIYNNYGYRLHWMTSPCRDAGDNGVSIATNTDLDGNNRIYNGIIDMGAYENDGTFIIVLSNEEIQNKTFSVYPNPATDDFYLLSDKSGEEITQISIINTFGQTVLQLENPKVDFQGIIHLERNGLPDGTYLIELSFIDGSKLISTIIFK